MTQTQMVLHHLKEGNTITAMEAVKKYGILRLAGRIKELRDLGYKIPGEWVHDRKTGKHYMRYRLEGHE